MMVRLHITRQRLIIIISLCLGTVVTLWGLNWQMSSRQIRIALVMQSESSPNFVLGAQVAAKEFANVELTVLPRTHHQRLSQSSTIHQAVQEQYDMIVLDTLVENDVMDVVSKAEKQGIRVLTLNTIATTKGYREALLNTVAQSVNNSIETSSHCILLQEHDANISQIQEQEKLVEQLNKVNKQSVEVLYVDSDIDKSISQVTEFLNRLESSAVLIGLNEATTEIAGRVRNQMVSYPSLKAIGIGSNRSIVSMLERRYLQQIVVQDYYALGYITLKFAMQSHVKEYEHLALHQVVTPESVFLPEMENILFPVK